MNRIQLSFLLIAVFFATIISAQELKIGFKAGLNVTSLRNSFDEFNDNKPRTTFSLNSVIELRLPGKIGISIEPGYIQKGGTVRSNIQFNSPEAEVRYDYIQVPTLLNIYLIEKLFLSLGPEFAFLINAKNKLVQSEALNEFEISASIGINFMVTDKIGIGAKYNRGFSRLYNIGFRDANGNSIGNFEEFNSYAQLAIRYNL